MSFLKSNDLASSNVIEVLESNCVSCEMIGVRFFPCDLDVGFKVSTNFIKTLVVKMTEKLLNIIKNQKQQICFIYDLCLNFWTVNFRLILRKFEFKIGKIVVPKFYFLGVLIFLFFSAKMMYGVFWHSNWNLTLPRHNSPRHCLLAKLSVEIDQTLRSTNEKYQ